jgi:hypothetical protein
MLAFLYLVSRLLAKQYRSCLLISVSYIIFIFFKKYRMPELQRHPDASRHELSESCETCYILRHLINVLVNAFYIQVFLKAYISDIYTGTLNTSRRHFFSDYAVTWTSNLFGMLLLLSLNHCLVITITNLYPED